MLSSVLSRTQVIGMSATLSNSDELAGWLGAALHVSDYRPIPLDERVLVSKAYKELQKGKGRK